MRIVAFITQRSVIDQIPTQRRTRATREAHAGARSPLDVGTGRHAPTRGGPARPLSTVRIPRRRAGTFAVGGGPTWASNRSPPAPCPRRCTGPDGPRGSSSKRMSRRRPPHLSARGEGTRHILPRPRSKFLSRDDDARVWISDDPARVIVEIKTKMSIGSITMKLRSYRPANEVQSASRASSNPRRGTRAIPLISQRCRGDLPPPRTRSTRRFRVGVHVRRRSPGRNPVPRPREFELHTTDGDGASHRAERRPARPR